MEHRSQRAATAKEVGRWLGVTDHRVHQLTRAGELPHFRIGRRVYYDLDEIRAATRRNAAGDPSSSTR